MKGGTRGLERQRKSENEGCKPSIEYPDLLLACHCCCCVLLCGTERRCYCTLSQHYINSELIIMIFIIMIVACQCSRPATKPRPPLLAMATPLHPLHPKVQSCRAPKHTLNASRSPHGALWHTGAKIQQGRRMTRAVEPQAPPSGPPRKPPPPQAQPRLARAGPPQHLGTGQAAPLAEPKRGQY